MLKKLQIGLCMALAMAFAVPSAYAQNPPVVAPKVTSKNQSFYVFGKQGKVDYGKEDSLQVTFIQVPVSAGSVTLYVYDPASGGKGEPASNPAGSKVDTAFRIYGGAGAYTASQSVRPTADQAGNILDQKTFGTTEGKNSWYAFGPYNTNQGEVIGDQAIFKIVAEGLEGDGGNLFKIGSSVAGSEVFAYDVTLHLSENRNDPLDLYVETPAGTTSVNVSNYDVDDAGKSTFAGQPVKEAGSGVWETTKVDVSSVAASRLAYSIVRDRNTEYANAGFHFTDGNGAPLRMFFVPGAVTPAPAAAPVVQNVCDINTSLVSLRQAMPGEAYLNQELSYTITVTALQNVANVKVTDKVGDNATYGSSTPAAVVNGKSLAWEIGDMDAGTSQIITVKITPTAEGMVNSCAVISADPRCCVGTFVGSPVLAIEKSGPEKALLGETVTYTIKVTNNGTAVAKDVKVTDTVPDGMSAANGQKTIVLPIGNLAPKQSQVVTVALKADARGNHCNVAEASSSNAGTVKDDACTLVQVQGLTVKKTTTTPTQFSGKIANYDIVVTNTGDTALTNVVVVDTVPDRMRIVKAEGAVLAGQTATWTIANLPAGETRSYKVDVTTPMAGELCNKVSVNSAEGLSAADQACTVWKGQAALLLEVIDTNDPLLPGEETTYVIQITNQGTADDHDVTITALFPAEISPTTAAGSSAITVDGKTVKAAAFPVLKPKEMIEWTIKAKGIQAGDSRLKVEMRSRLLETPVTEEESTHVY